MTITDTSTLPFNAGILGNSFIQLKPGEPYPDESGWWLLLRKSALLVRVVAEEQALLEGGLPPWVSVKGDATVVGLWQGRPLRVQCLDDTFTVPDGYDLMPFQGVDALLDLQLSTLAGLGAQILHWQRFSRYCSGCATELEPIQGTWGKRCPTCKAEHFPHIHPCVIVLIRDHDRFLLVRNVTWPEGRFSLVAGFLDLGESLEECVCREIREEAGVEVRNIRYVGSQAWPFPSQLMVGFTADYAGGEPRADGVEVAETAWFTSETLPYTPLNIRSISRWIMQQYGQPLN
ncbi:MAG: NAD(+) diphosphatase [Desulfuromonadaceae bacterium]